MEPKLLTIAQAAEYKGVSRAAIYAAIREGRLRHQRLLGRLAVRRADIEAWTPAPHTGRKQGTHLSEESRRRISQAQKRRWANRKGQIQ